MRITVIVALNTELKAVKKGVSKAKPGKIRVVACGVGGERAFKAASKLAEKTDVLISAGYAGSISDLEVGDVLIASEIISENCKLVRCSREIVELMLKACLQAGVNFRVGRLITSNRLITNAKEVSWSRALAVDMEAYSVALAALKANKRFAAVKVVSDKTDIPLEVAEALLEKRVSPKILFPPTLFKTFKLGLNVLRASESLTKVFHALTLLNQL
mgnify:CR=1 FL=1